MKIKNDECIILGNGSDIKYYNLKDLNIGNIFTCNNMDLHKDFHYLDILAYFWMHSLSLYPIIYKKNKFIVKNYALKLHNYKNINTKYFFTHWTNFISFANPKMKLVFEKHLQKVTDYELSNIKLIKTTLFVMLIKAYELGFKKVYLIGFDYLKILPNLGHFYEKPFEKKYTISDEYKYEVDRLFEFLRVKNFKIIGIYPKGVTSNFMEVKSYQNFFHTEIIYKENFEIIDPSNLDKLKHLSNSFNYKMNL